MAETVRERKHRIQPERLIRARELREDMTVPERFLWGRLRNGKLFGLKFRRQYPLGPFVLDYYCARHQLCVELDGESHADSAEADEMRTRYLEANGLKVIRVTNDQVLQNMDGVLLKIARACDIDV